MFDFEYKESIGFVPYATLVKSETEEDVASQEDMEQAQEDIVELSDAVAENVEAIAENAEAIQEESSVREAADEELSERINNIPKFQLTVVEELPEEGDSGTIYLVKDEGKDTYSEYVYADGAWEKLGSDVDLSDYLSMDELNEVLSGYYTKDEAGETFVTKDELDSKADVDDVYSKEIIDDALGAKADITDVYSRAEIDAVIPSFAGKEEVASLSGRVDEVEAKLNTADEKIAGLYEANLEQDSVIEMKADKAYTDSEVYKLTQIVGDLGGAVVYEIPNPAGKSFNALMSNNGTVKLMDNVETGRFGPGVTAKNTVKLNLNGHDLSFTGTGNNGAIMSRGTMNVTIGGKGTIDGGELITIHAYGADSVITLSGSTTVYRNSRNGGELVYCYAGTVNITNGTFRKDVGDAGFMLNCYDANYRNGTAKIVVSSTSKTSGPKFYDFNPADNNAEGEHTNFVAQGCEVQVSTVVEDGVEHAVYMVVKSAE